MKNSIIEIIKSNKNWVKKYKGFYLGVSKIALYPKIIDNLYNIKQVEMSKKDNN